MTISVVSFPPRWCTTAVTIASGSVTSSGGHLQGTALYGVLYPAGIQGISANVQVSTAGSTYVNVYGKSGTQLQVSVGASRYVYLGPDDHVRMEYVRLVVATTQTAARSFFLVSAPE